MSGCPTVHEHPEFQKSYNPQDKQQEYEIKKLKRYLESDSFDFAGEDLKYDLAPLKSFPRGSKNLRCFFYSLQGLQERSFKTKMQFLRI